MCDRGMILKYHGEGLFLLLRHNISRCLRTGATSREPINSPAFFGKNNYTWLRPILIRVLHRSFREKIIAHWRKARALARSRCSRAFAFGNDLTTARVDIERYKARSRDGGNAHIFFFLFYRDVFVSFGL